MQIKKIDSGVKIIAISVAIVVDIVEAVLSLFAIGEIIQPFVGFFSYTIYGVWFWLHGSFFFMKKGAKKSPTPTRDKGLPKVSDLKISWRQIIGMILEAIPVIGALPFFTYNVWSQINEVNRIAEEQEASAGEQNPNVLQKSRNQNPSNNPQNNSEGNPNVIQPSRKQNTAPTAKQSQNPNVIQMKRPEGYKKAA